MGGPGPAPAVDEPISMGSFFFGDTVLWWISFWFLMYHCLGFITSFFFHLISEGRIYIRVTLVKKALETLLSKNGAIVRSVDGQANASKAHLYEEGIFLLSRQKSVALYGHGEWVLMRDKKGDFLSFVCWCLSPILELLRCLFKWFSCCCKLRCLKGKSQQSWSFDYIRADSNALKRKLDDNVIVGFLAGIVTGVLCLALSSITGDRGLSHVITIFNVMLNCSLVFMRFLYWVSIPCIFGMSERNAMYAMFETCGLHFESKKEECKKEECKKEEGSDIVLNIPSYFRDLVDGGEESKQLSILWLAPKKYTNRKGWLDDEDRGGQYGQAVDLYQEAIVYMDTANKFALSYIIAVTIVWVLLFSFSFDDFALATSKGGAVLGASVTAVVVILSAAGTVFLNWIFAMSSAFRSFELIEVLNGGKASSQGSSSLFKASSGEFLSRLISTFLTWFALTPQEGSCGGIFLHGRFNTEELNGFPVSTKGFAVRLGVRKTGIEGIVPYSVKDKKPDQTSSNGETSREGLEG